MTETPVLEQEQAADPLDDVIGGLEVILGQLREARSHGGTSLGLRFRAAGVRKAAGELADLPGRLHREAVQCDAEATALRAVDEAEELLEQAADALRDAEEAYAQTGTPEQDAAGRVTNARQLAEEAADALAQAERDGAEPAILAELHGRVRDSAAVLEHESGKFAAAQSARQSAKAALDRARDQQRAAQETLAAAEAAAAEPSPESLDARQLADVWQRCWPWNLNTAALTEPEFEAFRGLVKATCDVNGWYSEQALKWAEPRIGQQIADTAQHGGTVQARSSSGHVITLGKVPGLPSGSTILASSAHAH